MEKRRGSCIGSCCQHLTSCLSRLDPMRYMSFSTPAAPYTPAKENRYNADIIANPMIDEQLETDLTTWQSLINIYRNDEDFFIDEQPEDAARYLLKIRYSPTEIFASSISASEIVFNLATLRHKIFVLMQKIGISYDDSNKLIDSTRKIDSSEDVRLQLPPDPLFFSIKALTSTDDDDDDEDMGSNHSSSMQQKSFGQLNSFQTKISKKWARRLGEIHQTQGSFNLFGSPKRQSDLDSKIPININDQQFKVRPKWPDYLGDTCYTVLKKNRAGQRIPRVIKLTEYTIFNIKHGNFISKTYFFKEIRHIWLEDDSIINITMKNGKRLMFISSIASHIAQQIITRVKVRLQLDRIDFSSTLIGPGYTPDLTSKIIEEISKENAVGAASAMFSFASLLKDNTLRHVEESRRKSAENFRINNPISDDSELHEYPFGVDSRQVDEVVHEEVSKECNHLSLSDMTEKNDDSLTIDNDQQRSSRSASVEVPGASSPQMFYGVKEGMKEFNLRNQVQSILFDPFTPEGSTRNHFLAKLKNTIIGDNRYSIFVEVRHFIDGMHEYILTSRGSLLSQLLLEGELESPNRSSSRMTQSLSFLRNSSRSKSFNVANADLNSIQEDILTTLSFIIFAVVEEAAYLPLREEIISIMPATLNTVEEEQLQHRMAVFKDRTQKEWSIKQDIESPMNWQSAKFELSSVESSSSPSMMLNALARTAKAIYSEYKLVVLPSQGIKEGSSSSYLGADDFLPIFIYVFCSSQLRRPVLNRDIMWKLCHPDQLQGECGYYLTVYESSIEFILNEPLNSKEQLTVLPPPKPNSDTDNQLPTSVLAANNVRMRESFS